MKRINVTKSFLPPLEEYVAYMQRIWTSGQLTNQGPLLKEFETAVEEYLGVDAFQFVSNGTIALQLALEALCPGGGEVITTPFSYVATSSAILWQNCTPVYVDIEPETFCIDPVKIEAAITPRTKAIMPVHVFGHPCDVEAISAIAEKHGIPVIYDAAHAFGVEYKGKSLLDYGDVSICSFHSTKLLHTIEGGGIVVKDKTIADHIELAKRFGHEGDDHIQLGINAKASEFQAAMGLVNLGYIKENIAKRRKISELYDTLLPDTLTHPSLSKNVKSNYGYYPVLFKNEAELLSVSKRLNDNNIFPRRYFYPSLNTLPYLQTHESCPISEDVASRVACLPLYGDMSEKDVERICEIINA